MPVAQFTHKQEDYTWRPGWTDYVADIHKAANDIVQLWSSKGKRNKGPVFELKKLMLDANMQ